MFATEKGNINGGTDSFKRPERKAEGRGRHTYKFTVSHISQFSTSCVHYCK